MVDSLDFLFFIVMQGSDPRQVKLNFRGWNPDLGIFSLSSQVSLAPCSQGAGLLGEGSSRVSPPPALLGLLLSHTHPTPPPPPSAESPQLCTLSSPALYVQKSVGPQFQQELLKQSM